MNMGKFSERMSHKILSNVYFLMQILFDEHYRLPAGLKVWFEPVEFTYVDNRDTGQTNVFYFHSVFADGAQGLYICVSGNNPDSSTRKG